MKASLQVANFTWPGGDAAIGPALRTIGEAAEEAGFDTLWVMDHFFQLEPMIGPADNAMLEGYSALSYLAGITERIRLGTLVTGVHYRSAGYLAKTVTTLDVLSGGRAWLGIGAGWYERESLGLGLPYPPLKDRFEQLEEALQIVLQMWEGDRSPFTGKHYQLTEPISSPQPLTKPRPPILIGGSGEKKTLRMVAQYADASNFFIFGGPEEAQHKLDVLKEHCERLGRDYDEISKTASGFMYTGQPTAELVEQARPLAAMGFDHAIFNVINDFEGTPIAQLGAEALPALAEL
ncbi:MAG: LLM class F420-dependent oxidoreductase [Acidimicrobiia bacterium]|nr:LLM class F420-dependent oxidoreductase [Acidimicrobiia bacterium]MDX2467884.1 LLM class F420-dependent oxidoreductase [Acidimicrobiia bacterium]